MIIITALAIALGFGVLIGFHEASHMLVSKLFGVKVNKFALGFGPILFSKKVGETNYELRALPLGGFVQCAGEDPESDVERGFFSLPWYKRALIALAGPLASLFLGYLLIFGLLLAKGWPILLAFSKAYSICSLVFVKTYQFFTHTLPPAEAMAGGGVSGPIMIVKILAESLKESIIQFMFILSIVSLSLGMFNLLPLPMLDGGHVFLYTLEGLRGKKWPVKAYVIWNTIGIVLLGTLMFYTVLSDIFHLVH
jgi:membrane-associated protease RseP (regulator of RpoE activity)